MTWSRQFHKLYDLHITLFEDLMMGELSPSILAMCSCFYFFVLPFIPLVSSLSFLTLLLEWENFLFISLPDSCFLPLVYLIWVWVVHTFTTATFSCRGRDIEGEGRGRYYGGVGQVNGKVCQGVGFSPVYFYTILVWFLFSSSSFSSPSSPLISLTLSPFLIFAQRLMVPTRFPSSIHPSVHPSIPYGPEPSSCVWVVPGCFNLTVPTYSF